MCHLPIEIVHLPIWNCRGNYEVYIYNVKTKKQITFSHSTKSIIVWFLSTYIIFGPVLNAMRAFSFRPLLIFGDTDFSAFLIVVRLNTILSYFVFMFLTYLVFYRFYPAKKIKLAIGMIIALIVPIILRFFVDQRLSLWLFDDTNYFRDITFTNYFADNTYFAVYYIPSGILYYFYRRNKSLQEARLEAEKQRAIAELTHLRSQINPHFLFNSLNNIYSLAYEKSDKILGAIEGLSQLLRYALYEKSEFVSFKKEWDHVLQLISIEKLRLLNPVDFKFEISEEVYDVMIPPVILLPLFENVFKHGDVQNAEHPPYFKANVEDDTLVIQIENKLSAMPQKDGQKGIGLDNIQKRILYAYGQDDPLKIEIKGDTFIITIMLPVL